MLFVILHQLHLKVIFDSIQTQYMKKISAPLLILLATLVVLASCALPRKPCKERPEEIINIDPSFRSLMPYHVNDTLRFKVNIGQVAEYVVQNDSGYGEGFYEDHECYYTYQDQFLVQTLQKRKVLQGIDNFSFWLSQEYPMVPNRIGVRIVCNGYVFLSNSDALSAPSTLHYTYDSINIDNQTYYSVRRILSESSYPAVDTLYYNKDFGIIKVTTGPYKMIRTP